jgi:hypothetical protein
MILLLQRLMSSQENGEAERVAVDTKVKPDHLHKVCLKQMEDHPSFTTRPLHYTASWPVSKAILVNTIHGALLERVTWRRREDRPSPGPKVHLFTPPTPTW